MNGPIVYGQYGQPAPTYVSSVSYGGRQYANLPVVMAPQMMGVGGGMIPPSFQVPIQGRRGGLVQQIPIAHGGPGMSSNSYSTRKRDFDTSSGTPDDFRAVLSQQRPVRHLPLARCKALYLGSAVPLDTDRGLESVQKPLRERYLGNSGEGGDVAGIEVILEVFSSGLMMRYANDRATNVWFPIQTLKVCAAVKYSPQPNQQQQRGGGRFGRSKEKAEANYSGGRFVALDTREGQASSHPPLFAIIMRRTMGVKVLECHMFLCRSDRSAMVLVQSITHSYEHREGWADDQPPSYGGGASNVGGGRGGVEGVPTLQRDYLAESRSAGGSIGGSAAFYQRPPQEEQRYYQTSRRQDTALDYNLQSEFQKHERVLDTLPQTPQPARAYYGGGMAADARVGTYMSMEGTSKPRTASIYPSLSQLPPQPQQQQQQQESTEYFADWDDSGRAPVVMLDQPRQAGIQYDRAPPQPYTIEAEIMSGYPAGTTREPTDNYNASKQVYNKQPMGSSYGQAQSVIGSNYSQGQPMIGSSYGQAQSITGSSYGHTQPAIGQTDNQADDDLVLYAPKYSRHIEQPRGSEFDMHQPPLQQTARVQKIFKEDTTPTLVAHPSTESAGVYGGFAPYEKHIVSDQDNNYGTSSNQIRATPAVVEKPFFENLEFGLGYLP